MINIQIIILLSLAAYVAGGVLFSRDTTAKSWDVEINGSSEAGSLSVNVDDESDSKGKDSEEIYRDSTNIPRQSGNNFGNFGNFGNQGASSNSIQDGIYGNLIGNLNINFERTADGFKINGRIVPGVNPYNAIEIDWYPQGGIAVNGDYKPGFEDIIYSGRTILGPILNPFDSDGTGSSEHSTAGEKSHKKNDYQSRYQNRGRLFREPTIPTDNATKTTYDDLMNPIENITSFNKGLNNKRKGKAKTTTGDEDFSRTGVGKQGLSVECTDDGALVNGKLAPEYDVRNQPHFDMTGNGMKINGQQVGDTGSRQGSKTDKRYQKKGGNNIGLPNSNNINTNNVNWNNMNSSSPRPKQHGKAKSNIPAKSPKQKTTVANNQGCGAGGTLSNFGNFGNQDKRYQKKGGNNIGLANSNNINSSNVNLNNINSSSPIEDSEDEVYMPKLYGKAKSKIPKKSPKQKTTGANNQGCGAGGTLSNFGNFGNQGWQYNNRNNKDVQFNNVGNSGRQFNNIGNRGTQINHQGNGGGVQCINSGNIDYSGSESSGYDTSDSMQFDGYNTGWQYNNRNNKDMQFNNFGNRGRQINRQGNGGVQYNSSGNVGYTTFTQDNVTVEMNGDALTINGIKVPEVKAKNLKQVKWRKGSLKINGKINEKFTGIPGRGTMNF